MAQTVTSPEFISDADMNRMEKLGRVSSPASDFVSDADMAKMDASKPLSPTLLASRQRMAADTFDANQPSRLGGFLSEAGKNARWLGHTLMDTAPGTIGGPSGLQEAFAGGATPGRLTAGVASMPEILADSPVGQLVQRGRVALAGGPTKYVEQQMKNGAGTGSELQLSRERIAPEVAHTTDLAKTNPRLFNVKAYEGWQRAGANVEAAQKMVPPGTTVANQPITDKIEALIDEYRQLGTDGDNAVKLLTKHWNDFAEKGPQIPFDEFLKMKQATGKTMSTLGQFRETGAAAERLTAQAMRDLYGQLMESGGVTDQLKAANREYWLARKVMDDAGLSLETGRKIQPVAGGIAGPTLTQRAIAALKVPATIGGIGAGGYEFGRKMGLWK